MKYLKDYKIFEREFSEDWFKSNPYNYVVSNRSKKPEYKLSQNDKVKREWLSKIDWKDISFKEDHKVPMQTKYICIYSNKEYFIEDVRIMEFIIEDENFNRIHTAWGGALDQSLRGAGIGYKCYKAVINHVGWVRSSEEGTNDLSRNIWKNLIKDPDYWVFEVETEEGYVKPKGFIIFSKSMSKEKINQILEDFKKELNKIITPDPNF